MFEKKKKCCFNCFTIPIQVTLESSKFTKTNYIHSMLYNVRLWI